MKQIEQKNTGHIKRKTQDDLKVAKQDQVDAQCEKAQEKNKANKLAKELVSGNQETIKTIQDKSGECLTEKQKIHSRCTEYHAVTYRRESCGDRAVLDSEEHPDEDQHPTLGEDVEIAGTLLITIILLKQQKYK